MDDIAPSARPGRLRVGIVSAGRVGSAFGSALRAVGHEIIGAYATSEASRERLETMLPGVPALPVDDIVRASELVIFAVPDDELAPLIEGLARLGVFRGGQIVFHTAGRYGHSVLEPAARAGSITLAVHPAMTFTGTSLDVARLEGCPFAVSGPGMYLPIGQALVAEIGGNPVVVAEEDRALYHAALAHGANHLVTVVTQAMRILGAIGVSEPGEYMRPLVEAALDGALRSGEALQTGPVVRGDSGTVSEHCHALDALENSASLDEEYDGGGEADLPSLPERPRDTYTDIPASYRALAGATTERALKRRVLDEQSATRIRDALR